MEIKANRQGVRIVANGYPTDDSLLEDLEKLLNSRHDFLGSAGLAVETDRPLSASFLEQVAARFAKFPMVALEGVYHAAPEASAPIPVRESNERETAPKIVRHTLRSGQQVLHGGDVIIIGDVNPGAAVIAGGDILVFGTLRGSAFAGQPNHRSARIHALRFDPQLIRIGDKAAQSTQAQSQGPEMAIFDPESEQLLVVAWDDVRLPEVAMHPQSGRRVATTG